MTDTNIDSNIRESIIIESPTDATGSQWGVTLITGGFNKGQGRYYTKEALISIAALAESGNLQAMADHAGVLESKDKPEGSILKVVGWYSDVVFNEAANKVEGKLNMLTEGSPFPHLPKAMLEAHERGNSDLFQLSIRGHVDPTQTRRGVMEGIRTQIVGPLTNLMSTDLVTKGGAGGTVQTILASTRGEENMSDFNDVIKDMDTDELREAIEKVHPTLLDTPEAPPAVLEEKEEVAPTPVITETPAPVTAPTLTATEIKEVMQTELAKGQFIMAASGKLDIEASAKTLPEKVITRLRTKVSDGSIVTDALLTDAIIEEKEIYSEMMSDGAVSATPQMTFMNNAALPDGQAGHEAFAKRLQGLIAGKSIDEEPAFFSLKEAFYAWKALKGQSINPYNGWAVASEIVKEATKQSFDPALDGENSLNAGMIGESSIQESITSSSFTSILGTSLHRVFLDEYKNVSSLYGDYKRIISHYPVVTDFKTHDWTRRGIYNSLPTVAQGGTYQPVTSPSEEKVSLSVVKYGGLEDLTIEAIANDDLNALRSIPRDLATGAIVGRYRAVFDLFTTGSGNGATMDYDTVALFNAASHSNKGTTALTSDELYVAKNAMLQQTALSASEVNLFLKPKFMLIPEELSRIANQMFVQENEHEPGAGGINAINPVRGLAEPIVVPYWTDANNWYLVADPQLHPTIALALLQGHEDPMLLMQNDPTVDSVFTADKITIKVRDIRDQDILDHRSFYGEIVA